MRTMLFDGKSFASEIESRVRDELGHLLVRPKLVSVIVGDDPASILYTSLKKKAAERVGIEFHIEHIDQAITVDFLKNKLEELSVDASGGLMIQLPLPENLRRDTTEVLKSILPERDVDGLRWRQSGMMPATVGAIFAILEKINESENLWDKRFVVLGSRGNVGAPLVYFLREKDVNLDEIEIDTINSEAILRSGEVIISCIGIPGRVKGSSVRNRVISIDVGIGMVDGKVKGDMEREVYDKSSIAVPVPGGVGPVTVASLMSNSLSLFVKHK